MNAPRVLEGKGPPLPQGTAASLIETHRATGPHLAGRQYHQIFISLLRLRSLGLLWNKILGSGTQGKETNTTKKQDGQKQNKGL